MARRSRVARSKPYEKCKDEHDRISMLPDEILVSILSLLTCKEAMATSILSRRWRYLWTFRSRLNFDGTDWLLLLIFLLKENSKSLLKSRRLLRPPPRAPPYREVPVPLPGEKAALDKERSNYIRWVNYVIASLDNSTTIEEFRIFFNLDESNRTWIDGWVGFALARKVPRLELNLTSLGSRQCRRQDDEFYTFPYHLLHTHKGNLDFKFLITISLNNVNVNGETLEFFLSNCPLLEDLSVSESNDLLTLMVIGPFPLLKRLEISLCSRLNSVEIRDASLVHLKYRGKSIPFLLENVPLLVGLDVENDLLPFSSILPQLETCTLDLPSDFCRGILYLCSHVKMTKVKHLVLKVGAFRPGDTEPIARLMQASPCLQRFVLEVSCDGSMRRDTYTCMYVFKSNYYFELKEVEFVGYRGSISDLELVMHIFHCGVVLDKIVVNPCRPHKTLLDRMCCNACSEVNVIERDNDARKLAKKQLTKVLPRGIKLEILDVVGNIS